MASPGRGIHRLFGFPVLGSLYEGFMSDSIFGYLRSKMVRFRWYLATDVDRVASGVVCVDSILLFFLVLSSSPTLLLLLLQHRHVQFVLSPQIPEMATGSDETWHRNRGYSHEIRQSRPGSDKNS